MFFLGVIKVMTALSAGASLTRYHSRYPAFDGAKVLLIFDSTKYSPVFVKRLKSVLLKQNHSKLNRTQKESKSKHKLDLETTKKLNWKL